LPTLTGTRPLRIGRSLELPETGFDLDALCDALDAQRRSRGMTWQQMAKEIGDLDAATLTRLSKGGRISFPGAIRILRCLGSTVASYTRVVRDR
jgi:hypothetical protein